MKLPFYHVDVFTSQRFGGNPLAVFLDADDLDGETMQKIAREMNLSESTFVMKPADDRATQRVRIFTPGHELPFAGHPTIGTSFVLQRTGRGGDELALEMEAGIIPVRREGDVLWMTPPAPEALSPAVDRAAVAQALGLPVASVVMPPQVFGGRGPAFLCVLLDTEQNVDWVMLDRRDLVAATGESVGEGDVLIFSYQGGKAYSRMYAALAHNVGEDPATGSSVGPLCAALAWWRLLDQSRTELTVDQGVAMGRPSRLLARFVVEGTYVQQLTVGGSCVYLYESTLEI
ncbi:MAG TPA: PhzF family phenazine biosynthesis protein [Candidatus Acidoferrales bacterium]|nr:PhzF family phenazine biosynthesis protein [Candidatus Acidoferrales bacterium]